MITERFKSAKEIWNCSHEEAIRIMKEELEEAMDEYTRLSDLMEEYELDNESYMLEVFVDNLQEYIDVLEESIDLYERMREIRERLSDDWCRIHKKILF